VAEPALSPTASQSDGGNGVDERDRVERVAERIESDCLRFLNDRVMAFVPFSNVFLTDALLEMIDDLVDMESADLAIAKSLDDVPLPIQSNL